MKNLELFKKNLILSKTNYWLNKKMLILKKIDIEIFSVLMFFLIGFASCVDNQIELEAFDNQYSYEIDQIQAWFEKQNNKSNIEEIQNTYKNNGDLVFPFSKKELDWTNYKIL